MKIGCKSMNHGKGQWSFAQYDAGVQCNKYTGKFVTQALNDKAELELWHTVIIGNPHLIKGEGHTPESAIRDAIKRNKELIQKLQAGVARLEATLVEETVEILKEEETT